MTKEIVICAAIKVDENRIIRGHRHADCIQTMRRMRIDTSHTSGQEGFITSQNRFVSRHEGYAIQHNAGIKSVDIGGYSGTGELYSEDLY